MIDVVASMNHQQLVSALVGFAKRNPPSEMLRMLARAASKIGTKDYNAFSNQLTNLANARWEDEHTVSDPFPDDQALTHVYLGRTITEPVMPISESDIATDPCIRLVPR